MKAYYTMLLLLTPQASSFLLDFLENSLLTLDSNSDDLYLNSSQLIAKYGFPVETHRVQTKDGYILTMFRIPCGGPPVFLMHGLILSSDDYIIAGPENAIAYKLAKEGYDVWMGNARGNKHSRAHLTLSPNNPAFWNFSWHEIGIIDVPTMIDYTLNKTGQSKLIYIGHSQGTTSFFVMCSERPEYNNKISVMIALAAAAYISNMKSPAFKGLALFEPEEYAFVKTFHYPTEILPSNEIIRTITRLFCSTKYGAALICANLIFPFVGYDFLGQNFTNLPNIAQHAPAGSSVKQFLHFFQLVNSGAFRQFDYREQKNIEVYGTPIPPSYLLNNVTAPVFIFYSDNDWLVSVTDANRTRSALPNVTGFYRVPYDKFNHLDYLWSRDIKGLVYYKMSSILKNYVSTPTNNTGLCPTNSL